MRDVAKKLMLPLKELIARIIELRKAKSAKLTLLAVCPNSAAVLEAAVKVATQNNTPMLFAATLNQIDKDGGYTGWTPAAFVRELHAIGEGYQCRSPLYACLDHGGPWLKDKHTLDRLSLEDTMDEVKRTLSACIEAGYSLLHMDTTIDRTLRSDRPVPIELVVDRTIELIAYSERERRRLGMPPISYEVGTEEVHGGLVDLANFGQFIRSLHAQLTERDLLEAWPCFVVGKVGTDLHTPYFDPDAARDLYEIVAPLGSLVKGHYTDWVADLEAYPESGMGGANVGPEFTSEEYLALAELAGREMDMLRGHSDRTPSRIVEAIESAVVQSNRWLKWLKPEEEGVPFGRLVPERRSWLVRTGARYIWTDDLVQEARRRLYENLSLVMSDPDQFVVNRIARSMDHYITAFHLFDSISLLVGKEEC